MHEGPGTCAGALVILHGVSDGTRTRGHRHHKPVLYQLSYAHHAAHRSALRADRSLTDAGG